MHRAAGAVVEEGGSAGFSFVLRSHSLFCIASCPGRDSMADQEKALLIKRYASRRLYNTETSDYVTLEDIAGFIREGREVQIVDLKSGDDLTRQYLLQIIAEHESRGENVLPVNVLNDLVRSYMQPGGGVMPQFLQASFDMLRDSQSQMVENISAMNPMSQIPGFDAMKVQQEAFLKAMTAGLPGGLPGGWGGGTTTPEAETEKDGEGEDLDAIKRQLSELQDKLSKLK
jgi:polyhydroxyalkanoate synthesis repressor PhaR